ncbi:transglutaminase family protein [Anatilimnocola floriformis]|uniref:transglutaminase family protein n=1 Tax=Anatilimnocola floriformis TaxID=2948575 RepID=UPI0020C2230E|nr:transglutaminase family protein [Anatilimnocola floriformis]
MKYKVTHTTIYDYSDAVPVCHNEIRLWPRDHRRQVCLQHRLRVRPEPAHTDHRTDYFGNHAGQFAIEQPHNRLTVTAVSQVQVTPPEVPAPSSTPPWEDIRDRFAIGQPPWWLEARQFVLDSPYVQASSALRALAEPSFTPGRPWLEAVLDLTRRIYTEFKYDPAATNVNTALETVLRIRRGVCQDFAHLQIGCLRSLGLPARYVSGYLLTQPPPGQPRLVGADASHAWVAAFCPEAGWIDFDPTNNVIPGVGHVTLAWGRDYGDVCPIKGVVVGGGQHRMRVAVDVAPMLD